MRYRLLLISVFMIATASAQEKEIWACQGIASNGFNWRNGTWEETVFKTRNVMATLVERNDGLRGGSSVKESGNSIFLGTCVLPNPLNLEEGGALWSCNDSLRNLPGSEHFQLNRISGLAVLADFTSATFPSEESRESESTYMEIFQCAKF